MRSGSGQVHYYVLMRTGFDSLTWFWLILSSFLWARIGTAALEYAAPLPLGNTKSTGIDDAACFTVGKEI